MTPTEEADYYMGVIGDLLATKNYEWCRPTLEGIADNLFRSRRITLRQKEAVEHIIHGRLRHDVR